MREWAFESPLLCGPCLVLNKKESCRNGPSPGEALDSGGGDGEGGPEGA